MVSTIILTRNVKTISFHYIPPINKYKTKVIINSWEHKLLPALDSCKNYTICHVPRMLIYERDFFKTYIICLVEPAMRMSCLDIYSMGGSGLKGDADSIIL